MRPGTSGLGYPSQFPRRRDHVFQGRQGFGPVAGLQAAIGIDPAAILRKGRARPVKQNSLSPPNVSFAGISFPVSVVPSISYQNLMEID